MIIYVKSTENKIIKHIKKLVRSNYREKTGQFFCEGVRIAQEAIKIGKELVKSLIVSRSFFDINSEKIRKLSEKFITYVIDDKIFSDMSTVKTPQGIIVLCTKKNEELDLFGREFVLILDGISNPGNMGTIIRTAEAAGVDAILTINNCVDIYNPKTVRSSMGSIFRMKIFETANVDTLENLGFRIITTSLHDSKPIQDVDFSGKIAIVVGSEATGISDKIAEISDEKIRIPMHGNVESLNAAQAAAVVMYFAEFKRGNF
jgi:TrmH family RNA methyltransferase